MSIINPNKYYKTSTYFLFINEDIKLQDRDQDTEKDILENPHHSTILLQDCTLLN